MSANYVDDVRHAEPISVYEETDEEFERFCEDLWDHAEKPTTLPEDFDFETDDPDDFERVVDEERVDKQARNWFNFAYGYANYGRGANRENLVVFKLPGWFAQDELGEWTEWWFGNLEVAKQDDDDEWTAMCLSNIEPMSDRNEDDYFRSPIEEEWIPVSLTEFAFSVIREVKDSHLIFERGFDSSTIDHERGEKADADIVVEYGKSTQYGRKFVIDSPYEAKDALGDLDWNQFHARWNGDNWEFDVGALWPFIEEMTMQGWSVCVTERVERETTSDSFGEGPYLPAEATEA